MQLDPCKAIIRQEESRRNSVPFQIQGDSFFRKAKRAKRYDFPREEKPTVNTQLSGDVDA